MPDKPAYYWDSCVPLSYINEIADRMPVLDALLESSSRGEIRLYTSDLSRVEVAFSTAEKDTGILDQETERRIDSLWEDTSAITMVESHGVIGKEARNLIRAGIAQRPQGWSLKPFDAVHLATAQWLSNAGITIDEFHTYDKRLFRYGTIVGFKIMEPTTTQPKLV